MAERAVVALGPVDTDTVGPVLGERVTFATDPSPDDLAVAEGAIARVGVDVVDLTAASARGIPAVNAPGSGSRAVAEGVFAMAPRVTKGPRPLTGPEATLAALESGRSSGVGPDVSDPEPARHHPPFDHPDVCMTPHLMGMTRRAMTLTFVDARRDLAGVVAGRPPTALANPEWYHRKATA
ncbi:hypothetical protein OOK58_08025 [Streptomyces sp. NBC_01728]|uniref:NAD(P)-dependent oxidoreductase n=1 Tax=unclassified Streptomyces TaxID=2593676 RepID=UPI0022525998|nr:MULTISPECIES: NAD(P)-dependent oxidoreductase [unclassified Streptomyces]MCX4452067.1 hypothetical protein [Streptomyces sp. NBC_01719]MCX4491427.1 hypothetical protein [Streptomyces sp. NBC_01728]